MRIQELMDEIENGGIHADLQLASTTYTLLERLQENPGIREARWRASENPEDARQLLQRAVTLFETPVPEGYVHPDDLALAAYLFILARIPGRDIERFIDRVARANRREFFRATPLARYIASRVPETTECTVPMSMTRGT